MNMLADADLPEADDEFSYREDPRPSLVGLAYPPMRILAAARLAATDARYLYPLLHVNGDGMDKRLHPLIPLPASAWTSADARWRAACGLDPLPEVVESKDNDPTVPLRRCPVCWVLSGLFGKWLGGAS